MNIKLKIAYDGTLYLGWQKTKFGPSIEEALEKAISQILQEEVSLQAASRTDAGVHAEGQIVNFTTIKEMDLALLKKGISAVLPKDISLLSLEQVHDSFHPTLDSTGKEYHYRICQGSVQLPFHRHFSWYFPYPLCMVKMYAASRSLLGEHDFSAFCNDRSLLDKDATCHIFGIEISLVDSGLKISITGDHFLYKMVRNIAGTLAYIGCGKILAEELPLILQSKDRKKAGMTAPAHGLTLNQVFYKDEK
jgi:tRNA pseudouridine38-40 synthase